ncbi:uncharacterized protein LOC122381206 [Amphibalanus amphitrite]|uniref:uncharacterized protein LOC122381206 n=1 Tax=Amphibalanus amphitrite TaxID=1232801 RepID=UPI001C92617C|nr:uncharacterized protein LOC122381206 [Amphibalanus amphitrite]XP_043221043.1 uncharacterized protein LOC122381206 [Amphibalanus amphitrite]XP_043221044.1 uncharacterized protein LOC122381206 [Amphibalanus amphitrite]XP_043221045.1 uncharacterized protein LOC122381206 [Amphibalanus amphitrite]
MDNMMPSATESVSEAGAGNSPAKTRSPKKGMKPLATSNDGDTKIVVTESLPEIKGKTAGKRKGRVIASRYKESAKSRAVATPTKMSDSSSISINQSKLFSTATSSTPVSAAGKTLDTSVRPKAPPKMAPLDTTVRHLSSAVPTVPGKDKPPVQKKKVDKSATVRTKPLRVDPPAKTQKGAEKECVSEHQLLYNQYLQWTYLGRMAEASMRREQPQLAHQAQQLAGLVDTAGNHCADLERKRQAVTLYCEMAQLERQLDTILADINESADTVRADLSRLTTTLDATRNRLQLSGCNLPSDCVGELEAAAERCREALSALDASVSPHANLLQHTAEAVESLQRAVRESGRTMASSSELLDELGSLSLQEASLSLCSGVAASHQTTITSSE